MSIEENIFKRAIIDFNKLANYGFIQSGEKQVFTKTFMNGDFKAVVTIDKKGKISGEVYETDSDDIYFPLRVESMVAGFVGQVREEYEHILSDIKAHCCRTNYFIYPQANRLTQEIYTRYGDNPTFPWDKFDGYGVFKNPDSDKWYALIMNIDKSKLDKKLSGEIEAVNIKLDEDKIPQLLKKRGFYPAYHMNKKNWITIVLDDSVTDEVLFGLVDESHAFTFGHRAKSKTGHTDWLMPANPKFFDIEAAFKKHKEIIWKQSSDIKAGDTAYMYVGAPISAVLYKCAVTEADIDYNYADENLTINKVMKIKLLKKYDKNFMPFAKLGEYGVRAVRGPRTCPKNLVDVLK